MQVKIYGRGPIAMALVLFLRRQGVAPAQILLESIQANLPDAVAARPLALSEGSVQLLSRIVSMPGGAPIEEVNIGVLGHGLHSQLLPRDIGLNALGRVVRYGHLWHALHEALQQSERNSGFDFDEPDNNDDGSLQIIADGRPDANANSLDFGQSALTTELMTSSDSRMPAPGVAYERFKPDGPLALLPLPEPGRIALVWCLSTSQGTAMLHATQANFEHALSTQLGPRFSCMTLSAERYLTPLQRSTEKTEMQSGDETVPLRLGNAAQTLHPVAGQGMNLGLRDAFEVAAIVADGLRLKVSTNEIVRTAQEQRNKDRAQTVALTDQLARIADQPRLAGLNNGATQSMTIGLLDSFGPVRRALAKRFVFGQRKSN